MSAAPASRSQARMTEWRAAIVWLVAASGIVAIALGQVLARSSVSASVRPAR